MADYDVESYTQRHKISARGSVRCRETSLAKWLLHPAVSGSKYHRTILDVGVFTRLGIGKPAQDTYQYPAIFLPIKSCISESSCSEPYLSAGRRSMYRPSRMQTHRRHHLTLPRCRSSIGYHKYLIKSKVLVLLPTKPSITT